ncbi:MAG TPA: hypothetical protein ENG30_03530, partial [Thermofilaceae archaeon]|nr:hypothetical protein [Thermofilaceae archaeon]
MRVLPILILALLAPLPAIIMLVRASHGICPPPQANIAERLEVNWDLTWGGMSSEAVYAVDLCGDYLYAAGMTWSFGAGGSDILLLKVDRRGSVVWARTWGSSELEEARDLCVNQSYVYVAGGCLLKFNEEGGVEWAKTLLRDGDPLTIQAVEVVGDGVYVGSREYVLAKLRDGGSLEVEWALNLTSALRPTIIRAQGEGVLVAYKGGRSLAKFSSRGELVWAKQLDVVIGGLYATGNAIYVTGTSYSAIHPTAAILKLNSDGSLAWSRRWGYSEFEEGRAVYVVEDEVYVGGGSGPSDEGFILVLDSEGNLLYEYVYGDGGIETFEDLLAYNGRVAAVGRTWSTSRSLREVEGSFASIEVSAETLALDTSEVELELENAEGSVTSPEGSTTYAGSGDALMAVFGISSIEAVYELGDFPSPFTLGGVANVTFVVGETGSHGLFGLGARTTDVLGAIGVAYALGLASESGYCYWVT